MKKITSDLVDKIVDEAILEYTKNRFISEEEIVDLKKSLSFALDERIEHELIHDGTIILTINNL